MIAAAAEGKLKGFYVVGSNPVSRFGVDPFALSKTFVVVQDLFLTETAANADVVLPAACAYEKSGTFTNTCGDLQMLTKAGDFPGVKADLEIIVRIADRMGFEPKRLVPFGGAERSDLGQSRGVQSGEADRHDVWLRAHNLEPKVSPFDPMALLDEIQRLLPGYDVSRANLAAGNDEHTGVPDEVARTGGADSIVPAGDTLFTSGTLGRYSRALNSVLESRQAKAEKPAAAD